MDLEKKSPEKLAHISRFNLEMKTAGRSEGFRATLTAWSWKIYNQKLEVGSLYRSRQEIQDAAKSRPTDSDWFKKGSVQYDTVLNIPPTVNQELLKKVQKAVDSLPTTEGTRVKVQQSYGRTSLGSLMTRNIGVIKDCDRKDCLVCRAPESRGHCRDQSVMYQISCLRSPCVDTLDLKRPTKYPDDPQ